MKFLVDAQLPRSLARQLAESGHDAMHVNDLPAAGLTTDAEITRVADVDGRIVVTKDADFRHTHATAGHPRQLLLVTVGNVSNRDLLAHVAQHLLAIAAAFEDADFIELGREDLVAHTRRGGLHES